MLLKMTNGETFHCDPNLSAVGIAIRFNCWIKVYDVWYTPSGFSRHFAGNRFQGAQKRLLFFANPVEQLDRGRGIIIEMVEARISPDKITAAIIRMAQFERRIRREYVDWGWFMDADNLTTVVTEYYDSPVEDIVRFDDCRRFTEAGLSNHYR